MLLRGDDEVQQAALARSISSRSLTKRLASPSRSPLSGPGSSSALTNGASRPATCRIRRLSAPPRPATRKKSIRRGQRSDRWRTGYNPGRRAAIRGRRGRRRTCWATEGNGSGHCPTCRAAPVSARVVRAHAAEIGHGETRLAFDRAVIEVDDFRLQTQLFGQLQAAGQPQGAGFRSFRAVRTASTELRRRCPRRTSGRRTIGHRPASRPTPNRAVRLRPGRSLSNTRRSRRSTARRTPRGRVGDDLPGSLSMITTPSAWAKGDEGHCSKWSHQARPRHFALGRIDPPVDNRRMPLLKRHFGRRRVDRPPVVGALGDPHRHVKLMVGGVDHAAELLSWPGRWAWADGHRLQHGQINTRLKPSRLQPSVAVPIVVGPGAGGVRMVVNPAFMDVHAHQLFARRAVRGRRRGGFQPGKTRFRRGGSTQRMSSVS